MSVNMQLWTTDPNYIELAKFLIEKTKKTKSVLRVKQLAKEFKAKSESHLALGCLRNRIQSFRSKVHAMKQIDVDTKVKLLFALGASIDDNFLESLKTEADVALDDHQRIIKYKKNGGGLELSGTHITLAVCDRVIERDKRMMELLAQKSMKADSPITDRAFVKEFKAKTGDTNHIRSLLKRFNFLKNKIHGSSDFDEKTKLRMIFTSSASVPNSFLGILRKNALVEVDEKNRVTKYRANDGSLDLTGDHSQSAKTKAGWIVRKTKWHEAEKSNNYDSDVESDSDNSNNSSEEFETDSDNNDYLDGTGESIEPDDLDYEIPVRRRSMILMDESNDDVEFHPRKSRNSSAAASTSVNPESSEKKRKTDTERSISSKRAKPSSNDYMGHDELDDYDPNYSFHKTDENQIEAPAGTREDEEYKQKSGELEPNEKKSSAAPTSSKKKYTEGSKTSKRVYPDGFMRTDQLHDYNSNESIDDSSRIELKPFRGSLLNNENLNPMDEDIQVLERPPAPAPKNNNEQEVPIKIEDPSTPQQEETPGKRENPVEEEVKPKFTSQLKLLEAMKSLVTHLDIPSLSQLKSKICLKIWKMREIDKQISIELMNAAMELLIVRIANDSVTNLDETVDSVGFIHVMCYLKAAIQSSRLDGLNFLLEKITKRSKELASLNKSIPVEKIASALQTTLDVIGF